MTETIDQKAVRYLAEGRLNVERVDEWVYATCRGSDRVHNLGYDPRPGSQGWRCTCDASAKFGRRCSHLRALQLVVTRPSVLS